MSNGNDILKYYDNIAEMYDVDRFSNSYGQFVHSQECAFLEEILGKANKVTLDMGCGTGRFMQYADHGIDISIEMLKLAQNKYPNKSFLLKDADNTGFDCNTFDYILSMHMFMHLDRLKVKNILNEAYRILKPNGLFIFDFPSGKRRGLFNNIQKNWHGANAFTISEIKDLTRSQWRIIQYSGIMFLPIHRIPIHYRHVLQTIDAYLCKGSFKEYSSYLIVVLKKNAY